MNKGRETPESDLVGGSSCKGSKQYLPWANKYASIVRNKELVRRVYDELWNERNLDLADELLATGWKHHNPSNPEDIEGLEGAIHHLEMVLDPFPDIQFSLHDIVAEGDAVVVYWTISGTHEREFAGIPSTGEHIAVKGFTLQYVDEGEIVEEWAVRDSLGMLEQLGAAPMDVTN